MHLFKFTGKKIPMELVSFRLPTDLLNRLDNECLKAGVDRSDALRQIIQQSLKGNENE